MIDYLNRIDPFYFIIMAFVLVYCIYKIIIALIKRGDNTEKADKPVKADTPNSTAVEPKILEVENKKAEVTPIIENLAEISTPKNHDKLPYNLKDYLLTKNEDEFFHALMRVVNNKAYICPKVGLKDFLYIDKNTNNFMSFFGRISQRHVDFLLCHPITMKPLCAIELDDSSHRREKVKERDAFVEKVYKDANFPLLRFNTKNYYPQDEIENALNTYLER